MFRKTFPGKIFTFNKMQTFFRSVLMGMATKLWNLCCCCCLLQNVKCPEMLNSTFEWAKKHCVQSFKLLKIVHHQGYITGRIVLNFIGTGSVVIQHDYDFSFLFISKSIFLPHLNILIDFHSL